MMNLQKSKWEEFREAGLLWWINRQLHLFGWAITLDIDGEGNVVNAYPAKCDYRGFTIESEFKGFENLTRHMKKSTTRLLKVFEVEDDKS